MARVRPLVLSLLLPVLLAAASGCAALERLGGTESRATVAAERPVLVAAANPLAAQAGREVLAAGGTAVDAAVAIQATLGLVEPQSSGIGGGAFLMVFEAASGEIRAYDGRETAPAGATPDMFMGPDGRPLSYAQAVTSGRATGTPGAMAALHMAHERHGERPWSSLFSTAERLARDGFVVSPRLAGFVNGREFPQSSRPDVLAYFREADGTPVDAGDVLKNPAYAETMRALAERGPRALSEGPIAQAIVAKVAEAPLPGTLTVADLRAYRPRAVDPLCRPYRIYVVCVPPPPSSGVSVLQALAMLETTDVAERGPDDPQAWLLLGEAMRRMYADRDRWVADPVFNPVPIAGLLNPTYVAERARGLGDRAGPAPEAGLPPGAITAPAPDRTREPAGTSHFVVADRYGNVVSMTTTVESIFGTGRMAGGFFLNNQLTDFSFSPVQADGTPAANAVAAGKRPRSSMSPILVLDRDGRLVAALGSPGGSAILAYNLKTLVAVLDWEMSMQAAIDLPNLVARGDAYGGEAANLPEPVRQGLEARGAKIAPFRGEQSGLHGFIVREGGRLEGGADRRREGVVLQ